MIQVLCILTLVHALLIASSIGNSAEVQPVSPTTPEIFKQFSEHVVKIEVVESGSAAKAAIGTGFFVNARGHIITNYHVVSKLIHSPERYRIDVSGVSGLTGQAEVLAVDVVYDLAVLRSNSHPKGFLTLESKPVEQGTRLYSLGHPRDLGLTIVEGTYNGLLQHTLYPKVHFTGSLNPGMSGGPTMTHAGKVVGVNVATEGEQISFLVPAARAVALLERTAKVESPAAGSFLAEVGRQIHTNQERYLAGMFSKTTSSVALGPYSLPTKPADFFRCWADALRRKELPYVAVTHDCSTDDYVFVSSEQSSGIVRFYHQLISTAELNPAQFFTLYSAQVQAGNVAPFGNEEEVTPFRCQTRNVQTQTGKLKAVLCARQYVKLPGLYDAVFRAATLGARNVGLVTTLSLSGASFDNVQALTQRYMESIRWRR
ncbi:MAG: trypsin-like peptidase domain-containing protein [Deltaproteobacteria bacterium]|jgi:S1-C subfamily serine protease|nr:MAG: trypsin-like peptidase domain-containing protein [Deltaproteobacteria bacterium]